MVCYFNVTINLDRSIENVLLYEDIWKYKNASTDAEREYLADDIVETYLKERSILSVCIFFF